MPELIDETGNKYGNLTVLRRSTAEDGRKYAWFCRCDCGNTTVANGTLLRSGARKSCGCSKIIDEVGNRYGQLTVLEYAGVKNGKARWLCACDCGEQSEVSGHHLRSGNVQSCGCSKHLPEGESAFNRLLIGYQGSAKKRGISWGLAADEFKELTKKPCHYCGGLPGDVTVYGSSNGEYEYNGLDRIDSEKGYFPDNVLPCCWSCNRMKGEMAYIEFLNFIERIYEYRVVKELRWIAQEVS